MDNYLQVNEGKNSWQRYLSSTAVSLAFMIFGSILYVILSLLYVGLDGKENTYFDLTTGEFIGLNPTLDLLFMNLVHVFWIIGIWIGVRAIHKRKMRTFITAKKSINWKRIAWGFSTFFVLLLAITAIDLVINGEDYIWNAPSFNEYFFLLLVVLIFTPIQTTTEEIFFRGLLLQWIGKKLKSPFLLALVVGMIFGALHFFNPEMEKSAFFVGLDYLFVGFALTYISIKTGSLEIAIGAHAANNIFIFLFLATDNSVGGNVPSVFRVVNESPIVSFMLSIVIFTLFYFLSIRRVKKE